MISARHEQLESMGPREKVRHWAGSAPWAGIRVEQRTRIEPKDVLTDAEGNIIRMPPLIGKPCFAQPTAFARHGGNQPIVTRTRGAVPSRCMRCSARDACARVAELRLRVTPELRRATIEFERAGGSYGLKHPSDCPTAGAKFAALVQALIRHGGFKSVNDAVVLQFYKSARDERAEQDAKNKREARRRAILDGQLDSGFEGLLERYRFHRMVQLRAVLKDSKLRPMLPIRVAKIPLASAKVTADVWMAREVLRLQQRGAPNPSSIAAEMLRRWPSDYTSHNSLRARVPADLFRIEALEQLMLPGRLSAVWDRFDPREALEAEDATPYMAAAA